tara:strand:- start:897 stop:1163 length:267 start_codon:yes stop_codon:yes gene_type:complete
MTTTEKNNLLKDYATSKKTRLQVTANGIDKGIWTTPSVSIVLNEMSKTLCGHIDANIENIIQAELSIDGVSGFYYGHDYNDYCEIKAV